MNESSYPFHYAGEDADPPAPVSRRVYEMAVRADARARTGADPLADVDDVDQLVDAAAFRIAGSITELFTEANAACPDRNKASDGTIGDARHRAEGNASDHNPWVIVAGVGVVRAGDITNDPDLNLPAVAERIRDLAHAGRLPMVTNGGYAILNGRITKPDFSGWSKYIGPDPHVSHMHVSSSLHVDQFDSRATWGVFGATPPAPTPKPQPTPAKWTGPDLAGRGPTLRGQAAGQPSGPQSNGPKVADLQRFLNRYADAYSDLTVDGWYGPATAAVLREFARRLALPNVDGLNIGPRLAHSLWRAGFDR